MKKMKMVRLFVFIFLPCLVKSQPKDFILDTSIVNYKVRIKVFNSGLAPDNIRAFFSFSDSVKNGKLRFVYYYKFLPQKTNKETQKFVPIYQDKENRDNSFYLWNNVVEGKFDYENALAFVLKNMNRSYVQYFPAITFDKSRSIREAEKAYLTAFNGLIKKDYLVFSKSIHPAELKFTSYQEKSEKLSATYGSTDFKFISTSIDSVGRAVFYAGEIQILMYCRNGYKKGKITDTMKSNIIARSFDKGSSWYFKEISRLNYIDCLNMSKGDLDGPPISYELLQGMQF